MSKITTATWSLYTDLNIQYQEQKLANQDTGFDKATYLYVAAQRLPEPHAMKYIAHWWDTIHVDVDNLNRGPKKGIMAVPSASTVYFPSIKSENIWAHVILPYLIASNIQPHPTKVPVLALPWAREKSKLFLDKLPSEHIAHYMCNWELPINYLNQYTSQLDLVMQPHIMKMQPHQKNLLTTALLHHCANQRIGMYYLQRMLPDVASILMMMDTVKLEDQLNYMHFQIEVDAHNNKDIASSITGDVFEADL